MSAPPVVVRLEGADRELALKRALLVYETPGSGAAPFVTVHEVQTKKKGPPVLGPGFPLDQAAAARFAADVSKSLAYSGFVPPELLALGPGWVAWWCPPAKRRVWFDCTRANPEEGADRDAVDDGPSKLGNRSGVTPHPGLVFAASPGDWRVWAVKGAARPDADTALQRAPYFNVWADEGGICLGNVRVPSAPGPEAIAAYEKAFFESRFTHPNRGFRVRFPGGGYALWAELLAATPDTFPEDVLVDAGVTLGGLVRRLGKETR